MTQGAAASAIARGIDSSTVFLQAVSVNVSYTMVATALTSDQGEWPASPAEPAPATGAEATPDPMGPPAAEPVASDAEDPEPTPEPEAPSGAQASAFYYSAQVSFTSASIALELLR